MTTEPWPAYLEAYHAAHPAVTEDLLLPMTGPGGLHPYAWLAEGLPTTGPVWDVCCGSAPVADVVGHARYAGVDLSAAELAQAALRRPGAQVVRGDAMAVDPAVRPAAVTVAMALMLLPLEPFLARAARLLPAGGRLHAVVPTREHAGGTGYGTLLGLLGQSGHGYRQPLLPGLVAAALAGAGFALLDDEVAVFERPLPPEDVELVAGSFYLRGEGADGGGSAGAAAARERLGAARRWLVARSREPGYRLGYPLRRVRAVRLDGPAPAGRG